MSYLNRTWGPIRITPTQTTCIPEAGGWNCIEGDASAHTDPVTGEQLCFFAWANYSRAVKGWSKTSPIPIIGANGLVKDLNASNIRLTNFSCYKDVAWSGLAYNTASFLLYTGAGTEILHWDIPGTEGTLQGYTIPATYQTLLGPNIVFGLYEFAQAAINSWVDLHVWDYKIWGLYDTTTSPIARTVTVTVTDLYTGGGLANASVTLLSGVQTIDVATTDVNGTATLQGINTSYSLRVAKSGYSPLDMDIDMTNSDLNISVFMTLASTNGDGGGFDWMQYLFIIPIAVGGLGLMYFLTRRRHRGRDNGITVIK